MSRNFDSLNGLESLSLPTMDANPTIRATPSYAAILADELAQIERIVGDSIGKLKAVVEEGADAAKSEKAATEQILTALTTDVATLNSQLHHSEQSLQSRNDEVNELTGKLQLLTNQLAHLGQSLQQAKIDAASETQRALADVENAKGKIVALEARVGEAESTLRAKETAISEVEQVSSTRIAQLESQLRDKEVLVADGYRQMGALKSEVSRLKEGVLEMASLVQMHAKTLTDGDATNRAAAVTANHLNPAQTQPIYSQVPDRSTSALFDR